MPLTHRPGGWWFHKLKDWEATIKAANQDREKEAENRRRMAEEDVVAQQRRLIEKAVGKPVFSPDVLLHA